MGKCLIGDAVWAVLPKCHYWPGLIVEPKEPTFEWNKSTEDIFIYFFGLASYGWIKITDILPYSPNKEQYMLSGLEYFKTFDKTAVKLFVKGREEIDVYVGNKNLYNVLDDCPEKVEGLKLLISNANVHSNNYDKLRDCESCVFKKARNYTKRGFIRDIYTSMEISSKMNCVLEPPTEFGTQKEFPEEDLMVFQKFIDYPDKVKISSLFKEHSSDSYDTGDMVWAKMIGYAAWPGLVIEPVGKQMREKPKGKNTRYCIYFYGSHNYAWITNSALLPYAKYRRIMCLKGSLDSGNQKHFHSFNLACAEADNAFLEVESGKIYPRGRQATLKAKRDAEKRRYGFTVFDKADNLTPLGYEKILAEDFPKLMPSEELKFEEYVKFIRDMGINEFKKRKEQMKEEGISSINGQEIGLYGFQQTEAKEPRSVEVEEEVEYVTGLRHPFFVQAKNLPKIEPDTSEETIEAIKNYSKLFEYLISEDDLNGRRGMITTDTINEFCQEIFHDYDEDQDVSTDIIDVDAVSNPVIKPTVPNDTNIQIVFDDFDINHAQASVNIPACKQCMVSVEKLNTGMMERLESTYGLSPRDKKIVILSNADVIADVPKENTKECNVLKNNDTSFCSEISFELDDNSDDDFLGIEDYPDVTNQPELLTAEYNENEGEKKRKSPQQINEKKVAYISEFIREIENISVPDVTIQTQQNQAGGIENNKETSLIGFDNTSQSTQINGSVKNSEINQTSVTHRYDIPSTSGCSRANEVQLSEMVEREDIPIPQNNSNCDNEHSDLNWYGAVLKAKPFDPALTEKELESDIKKNLAEIEQYLQNYKRPQHVSDNDDLSFDDTSSIEVKEKTLEFVDNPSSTKSIEFLEKRMKDIQQNIEKCFNSHSGINNCVNEACIKLKSYLTNHYYLTIPLKRKSTSNFDQSFGSKKTCTNSINLSTIMNNEIKLNKSDTSANMDVQQQLDTPSTSYQSMESSP